MEIYVMKKKFVLTLALVLMVAATLVAAPLDVSGDFKAGYKLTFSPNGIAALDATEAQANAVTVSGDFWSMEFGTITFTGGNDDTGNLTVYLDKALAAQGVDMGDISLKYTIGNMGTAIKPSDVYTDSNDKVVELAMAAIYASKVTLGYSDMVTVEFAADPVNTTDKPILLGATFAPVDGVKAAVGYTNLTADGNKGGVTGSATADLAALAGLDFGLIVSAIDVYDFNTTNNALYAEVKGSVEDIAAWVEYQNIAGTSNLKAKATYSGIENTSVYAAVTLTDLSSITTLIEGGASYKMGGVTYALDAGYTVNGSFTLSPSVAVAF